jgi:hypothetical protein
METLDWVDSGITDTQHKIEDKIKDLMPDNEEGAGAGTVVPPPPPPTNPVS